MFASDALWNMYKLMTKAPRAIIGAISSVVSMIPSPLKPTLTKDLHMECKLTELTYTGATLSACMPGKETRISHKGLMK